MIAEVDLDPRIPLGDPNAKPEPPKPCVHTLAREHEEMLRVLVAIGGWVEIHSAEVATQIPEHLRRGQGWGGLVHRGLATVERRKGTSGRSTAHYLPTSLGLEWLAGSVAIPRTITLLGGHLIAVSRSDLVYVGETIPLLLPEHDDDNFLEQLADL